MGAGHLDALHDPQPGHRAQAHFGGSAFALAKLGLDTKMTIYAGFLAVAVNLVVAVVVTFIAACGARRRGHGRHPRRRLLRRRGDARVHDLTDKSDVAPIGST